MRWDRALGPRGWAADADVLTDPLLVPWKHLSELAKTRYRLLASTITALAPLLA